MRVRVSNGMHCITPAPTKQPWGSITPHSRHIFPMYSTTFDSKRKRWASGITTSTEVLSGLTVNRTLNFSILNPKIRYWWMMKRSKQNAHDKCHKFRTGLLFWTLTTAFGSFQTWCFKKCICFNHQVAGAEGFNFQNVMFEKKLIQWVIPKTVITFTMFSLSLNKKASQKAKVSAIREKCGCHCAWTPCCQDTWRYGSKATQINLNTRWCQAITPRSRCFLLEERKMDEPQGQPRCGGKEKIPSSTKNRTLTVKFIASHISEL